MKKINACVAALVVAGLLLPTGLYAQYVGSSNQIQSKSVAEILKNPIDDQVVVLQGHHRFACAQQAAMIDGQASGMSTCTPPPIQAARYAER